MPCRIAWKPIASKTGGSASATPSVAAGLLTELRQRIGATPSHAPIPHTAASIVARMVVGADHSRSGTSRDLSGACGSEYVPSGVNPVAETRKLRTGYHLLTGNCQRSCSSAYWSRLVNRRRALLETNPPRNSQLETHRGR